MSRNLLERACRSASRNIPLLFLLLGLLVLWPAPLVGLGVRIPNQDAEAIGRGNAFAATADNPSALYYNPAGITQLQGHNIQFGLLNYLGIISDYDGGAKGRAKTAFEVVPVPQLYYAFTPGESPLSYGLGIYAPFGLGLKWPDAGPLRDLAVEGRLTYLTVNPNIAWKVHQSFSIALGPTINYSRITLRQGIGVPSGLGGVPNDEFTFKGDDFDYGFHAGVLWQPYRQWSLGANYRSPTSLNYRGHSDFAPYQPRSVTTVDLHFPQIVSGGISYRPTTNWNVEADVDWTDWNSVDTLSFKGASFFGNPVNLPLNWHSSWMYHFGVSRYFASGYFLSVGYFFCQNSTSEKFFTPYDPDSDLHVGSLGGGYKGVHWRWALAGQIITGPKRNIAGSKPSAFGASADGDYQLFTPTVSFSIGYHF